MVSKSAIPNIDIDIGFPARSKHQVMIDQINSSLKTINNYSKPIQDKILN